MKYKEFSLLNKYSVSSISDNPEISVYHKRTLSESDYWRIVDSIRLGKPLYLYNTNIEISNYVTKNLEISLKEPGTFPDFYGEFIFDDCDYMFENRAYFQNFKIINGILPKVEITLRPENLDFVPFGGSKAGKVLYGKT